MAASGGNVLYHADKGKDDQDAPQFGGDEESDGGDLEAAKRGGFNFDEF